MQDEGDLSSSDAEDTEEREVRLLLGDGKMLPRSESQSQLMKPLVFGLSEDMQYAHHKNSVKHFLINQNNK